ncbi:MAG: hypothetical protein LBJ00_17810 [Planctomycetaceae bacterium]|jgi:hypothetical protein|nr:hypothetical protein [Planctomycetaceae bacterium]
MYKKVTGYLILIFVTIIGLFYGCSNNPLGVVLVKGTVKVDGKNVDGISVTFIPIDVNERSVTGLTTADGSFVLTTAGAKFGTGAVPGKYHVAFSKVEFETVNETVVEKFLIPSKYSNPTESKIEPVEVENGKSNVFNFDLTTN